MVGDLIFMAKVILKKTDDIEAARIMKEDTSL